MSTVISWQMRQDLAEGSLTNDTSELIQKFISSKVKAGVLNIHSHIESDGSMSEILNNEQLMGSVGAVFYPEAPARAYQISINPAASYDAIIFVRNATPARFID